MVLGGYSSKKSEKLYTTIYTFHNSINPQHLNTINS